MKKRKLLILIVTIFLSGCASTTFYQLYKTESSNTETDKNGMIYENDDIIVFYNFWENYGNSSFLVENKTDLNIFINLEKSHLIINGMAKTYFQNRTFLKSSSTSLSVGSYFSSSYLNKRSTSFGNIYYLERFGSAISQSNTIGTFSSSLTKSKSTIAKGYSVSFIEKNIVCIPAKSAKIFDGFSLNGSIYRDCELFRYPSKTSIESKKFDKETTPLIIKNIISYGFIETELNNFKIVESVFWVSEITNYPSSVFYERKYPEYCGKKSLYSKNFYLFYKPDRFFIKYNKE